MNNQPTGKPKRAGERHPLGWKKPLRPHNRIPMVERTCQNRGTALAENPREVEVETVEQHQKATHQQAEENGTQSCPARRQKPQPSSRHTSWAHIDSDRNRKGGPVKKQSPQTEKRCRIGAGDPNRKARNKTVSRVTRREIYPTVRDKGTGGEGRSDSGDQRVNKCYA